MENFLNSYHFSWFKCISLPLCFLLRFFALFLLLIVVSELDFLFFSNPLKFSFLIIWGLITLSSLLKFRACDPHLEGNIMTELVFCFVVKFWGSNFDLISGSKFIILIWVFLVLYWCEVSVFDSMMTFWGYLEGKSFWGEVRVLLTSR